MFIWLHVHIYISYHTIITSHHITTLTLFLRLIHLNTLATFSLSPGLTTSLSFNMLIPNVILSRLVYWLNTGLNYIYVSLTPDNSFFMESTVASKISIRFLRTANSDC